MTAAPATSSRSSDAPSDPTRDPAVQGTVQGLGVVGTMGKKLLDARLKAPVRMGKGERDVFEAPLRVHSGLDGVSKALSRVDTSGSAEGSRSGKALRGAKSIGKGLVVVGAALDALDLGRSLHADVKRGDGARTETKKAVGRIAGGWGGAIAGASAGTKMGAFLPFGGPIAGMVVGSIIGGIGGHVLGEKTLS